MNLINIILVLALVVRVRSDCGDYFECLSGFVKDYLSGNAAGNKSVFNDSEIIHDGDLNVTSIGIFDLSDIGRSLSQALTDVTTLIKSEIKGMFNINDEIDIHKKIENKTEIHVKAFGLDETNKNMPKDVNKTQTEVIVNNLTKFNEELNALKDEIEKNLQAELESFISQILENDTVDWVEVTEDSYESDLTTTLKPFPDFEEVIELTTETNSKISDAIVLVKEEPNNDGKNIISTTTMSTKSVENKETIRPPPVVLNLTLKNKLVSKPKSDQKNFSKDTSIKKVTTSKSIIITPHTTSQTKSTTISPTPALNTIKDNVPTTSIKPQTTTKETTTSKEVQTENDTGNLQTHTISPIDYKLLENVKVNEILDEDSFYYEIQDDNTTDYPIIDYVDLYKDTTNEALDYVPTLKPFNEIKSDLENIIQNEDVFNYADNGYYTNDTTNPASIFPWLAAIFIKNGTNNQFDYYCDGTLLSDRAILTAARCLQRANETVNADDVIVFLGKRSLQNTAEGESIQRVKQIIVHSNFNLQENTAQNDLAVLLMEETAVFSELIQPACLKEDNENGDAVATAWGESLSLIKFAEKNRTCVGDPVENTFCATYGASVALCPSYGGVYASLQTGRWCAAGVRTGDVTRRGLCFDKTVSYTDLRAYTQWLKEIVQ